MPSMQCTLPEIVLVRSGIMEQLSKIIEKQIKRHQVLLKIAIGKINSPYSKCSKYDKNINHVKNRQYKTTRRADKICKMISQMIAKMGF